MIEAIFTPALPTVTVTGLFQWDYGQILKIQGLELPPVVQVHFSASHDQKAKVRMATKEGEAWLVPIPDELLKEPSDLRAWIYEVSENAGETLRTILLPVVKREQPENFIDPPEPDDTRLITEFITVVNDSISRMEQMLKDSVESNTKFQSDMALEFKKYYEDLKLETQRRTVSAFDVTLIASNWVNNRYTVDISSAGWTSKSRLQPNILATEANMNEASLISGYESDGKTFTFIADVKPTQNISVSIAYFGEQN